MGNMPHRHPPQSRWGPQVLGTWSGPRFKKERLQSGGRSFLGETNENDPLGARPLNGSQNSGPFWFRL